MAFHFPLMPRMFVATRMEDRFPITDIWSQTPAIDESCQWALFLRNHDELTLEMVTNEERDYMYRAYALEPRMRVNLGIRRRLAPLLGNNRKTIELKNALLFSLPGTPVLYYGDEIGMGDNVYLGDRDGVRTPMQWSGDRNAGFSRANPQKLVLPVIADYEYHYQTLNVENQESNRHSLLWWMRRLIALRKQFKAFGRGSIEFLNPENPRILVFFRTYQEERILVVANLSRFVQYVELDLSKFEGMVPVELIGRTDFPPIGELPYFLTLGPHAFYWFSLEKRAPKGQVEVRASEAPRLEIVGDVENVLREGARGQLERALLNYLPRCRWFGAKAKTMRRARVSETVPLIEEESKACLALVDVEYGDAEAETYCLPLAAATGEHAQEVRAHNPDRVVAELRSRGNGEVGGLLYDAVADHEVCFSLLELIERRRRLRGINGELMAFSTSAFRTLRGPREVLPLPRLLKVQQSNSSIVYGDSLIMKLFRRLDVGVNPDLEISRFLTEHASFTHTPPVAGWLEYRSGRAEPRTIAILQGFVANQGDAWDFTLRDLSLYFERATTMQDAKPVVPNRPLTDLLNEEKPEKEAQDVIGAYLDAARLLGHRTAELHLALTADAENPDFAPEPYSTLYQRSIYQSMRNLTGQVFRLLSSRRSKILAEAPPEVQGMAQAFLTHQDRILARFGAFLKCKLTVARIRGHGDLHLGQVLNTGKDFVIIDFEGEPARPLSERRRKHSALRDVAGMMRSFHYAAFGSLLDNLKAGTLHQSDYAALEPWAELWQRWTSWAYLKGYLETAGEAPFVPRDREELRVLLDAFLLEKAVYEVGYELNNRPDWMRIPIHGIEQIVSLSA
jgi:maltose alpha-D-glucosyltransferase/alpha-amylase